MCFVIIRVARAHVIDSWNCGRTCISENYCNDSRVTQCVYNCLHIDGKVTTGSCTGPVGNKLPGKVHIRNVITGHSAGTGNCRNRACGKCLVTDTIYLKFPTLKRATRISVVTVKRRCPYRPSIMAVIIYFRQRTCRIRMVSGWRCWSSKCPRIIHTDFQVSARKIDIYTDHLGIRRSAGA